MTLLNRRHRRVLAARRKDPGAQAIVALLKKEGERLDDHDYMRALEDENKRLAELQRRWDQEIGPAISQLPEQYEAYAIAQDLRLRLEAFEQARPEIEELPSDLAGVVDLIGRLYPDRVQFTEDAKKAATVAAFQDPYVSWRMLRSIATTLFDLFGTGCDLEKTFRDRAGFELALTETSSTKEVVAAVRKRMVRYGDRFYFAGGHVKYGVKPPRLLRAHFIYPDGSPTIIVTHVGDHLVTAGTRRLRT